jgi:hypothetical protein
LQDPNDLHCFAQVRPGGFSAASAARIRSGSHETVMTMQCILAHRDATLIFFNG